MHKKHKILINLWIKISYIISAFKIHTNCMHNKIKKMFCNNVVNDRETINTFF